MKSVKYTISAIAAILLNCAIMVNAQQQLAFPSAEGYGKFTKGGRGGKVYEVTTLSASGAGSLGEAINATGPRTVVFRVSGTIEGSFTIKNSNITIAGQTAPGDGICIKGHLGLTGDDIIVRYIRARPNASGDAIGGYGNNIIFDHVSCSWSSDEVMSIYRGTNVTIQYCLISEAAGSGHRFGGIWGGPENTYHHNCFAHNDNRTPRWAGKQNETNDYRNNVLYNIGYGGCYGGWEGDKINMIANYYKPGPATADPSRLAAPSAGGDWHVSKNVMIGADDVTQDNWKGMLGNKYTRNDQPWPAMPIREETAEEAYETFLAHGGCSFPNRDALDKRIIEEIRTGTAKHGAKGMITRPADAGGWPELKSTEAPSDKDHDGMPDAWETANGLNPDDASDGSKTGKDGYTNLENYINGLVKGIAVTTKERKAMYSIRLSHRDAGASSASPEIQFFSPIKSKVKLEVFGITGKTAAILVDEVKEAGIHSVNFNSNLAPGAYIYRLSTPDASLSKRIFLTKR